MRAAAAAVLALSALVSLVARADGPAGTTVALHGPALASHPLPPGDAACVAYVPAGPRAGHRPRIVVLLHGWESCAPGMVAGGTVRCGGRRTRGYGLGAEVDRSGGDVLFLVPQLAMLARDARPGRFDDFSFRAAWLPGVLDAVARDVGAERVARFRSAPVVLAAHSGGYQTLLSLLRDPTLRGRTDAVVLFDGLYGGTDTLAAWVAEDASRRVVSLHTGGATTTRESAALVARATALGVPAAAGDDIASALRHARVVSVRTSAPHVSVPERHLAAVLAALDVSP